MEITLNKNTVVLRDSLFWDIPKEKIDAKKNALLIIERVLTRGNKDEFADIVGLYGEPFFIKNAQLINTIDNKTANYLAALFNIKRDTFKCYSTKR